MELIKKDNRLYRGKEVAVIISPGFGAGWSSWNPNNQEQLLFDADIAEALLEKNYEKAIVIAGDKYPKAFLDGLEQARVTWVQKGAIIEVKDFDGSERLTETYIPEGCFIA